MKSIGIISAMEEEIIALKRKVIVEEVKEQAGMTFFIGSIKENKIILVRCENGMVSPSICVQILNDLYHVDYIISTGVAGGIYPAVGIGDMIIASHMAEGDDAFFKNNHKLVQMADSIARIHLKDRETWIGQVIANDQFVTNISVKGEVESTCTAYCAEMECGAIAYACFLNQIPFLMLRIISDKVGQNGEINFEEFVHMASRNESKVIVGIIDEIK